MQIGALRLVLQACNEMPVESDGWLLDAFIAQKTGLELTEVRDCIESLDLRGYVSLVRVTDGLKSHITSDGRLFLSQRMRFPEETKGDQPEPAAIKIVPKGLRSFDEHDKDFFLELLPGPRRGDGLPESVHFWKVRIEETDPDKTFKVGVIYGPSGCGKSSLVQAGLLPNLADHVRSIHVAETSVGSEARLLHGLRKCCTELPTDLGLAESISALSEGRGLSPGTKVLIVLDQFEQWLSTWQGDEKAGLVSAIRHCDGGHVQAIVMVRSDDFWMAVNRFEEQLGVEFRRTQNSYAIDLFDHIHARNVLAKFGQAFDRLPDEPDQRNAFLDQAVEELGENGKIAPVRLSLFTWMVRDKPWTPTTLKEVGGAEGVGVNFLEETFGSPAEPKYRLHQRAAQAVLKALFPKGGTRIRGESKSYGDLMSASGYDHRPEAFDKLCSILDEDVRLITPTAPEEPSDKNQDTSSQPQKRYYQLTHDYLVPSIRKWLTRKQRETRRGRAELLLAERSELWNAKPENRFFPSIGEWGRIRLLTRKKEWTQPQRRMMKRAGILYGLRALGLVLLLTLGTWSGIEGYSYMRAAALVDKLTSASMADVPPIIEQLKSYRRWAIRPLDDLLMNNAEETGSHLRASLAKLALVPDQEKEAKYLVDHLSVSPTVDLAVIWEILRKHSRESEDRLWKLLENPDVNEEKRFRVACALASSASPLLSSRWNAVAPFISEQFVTTVAKSPADYSTLIEMLRPLRRTLAKPLTTMFNDIHKPESEHRIITNVLADYASDDAETLANLLMDADPKAYLVLFPVAERLKHAIFTPFEDELNKSLSYRWDDPPMQRSWTSPDPKIENRIKAALGLVENRFAFCQTMRIAEFLTAVEELRQSGYRPVRFRPYTDGQELKVAAVWNRDGRNWHIASGLSKEQLHEQNKRYGNGFVPVDCAGYLATAKDGKLVEQYASIWVQKTDQEQEGRSSVGLSDSGQHGLQAIENHETMVPLTLHAMKGADGKLKYSVVHGRSLKSLTTWAYQSNQSENRFRELTYLNSNLLLTDLCIFEPTSFRDPASQGKAALADAEEAVELNPSDQSSRYARAIANIRLERHVEALKDLLDIVHRDPQAAIAISNLALVHARLGNNRAALYDLQVVRQLDNPEVATLVTTFIVKAQLGLAYAEELNSMELAIRERAHDHFVKFAVASGLALASKAVTGTNEVEGERMRQEALRLLKELVSSRKVSLSMIEGDFTFDYVRSDPRFEEIQDIDYRSRRYCGVWAQNEQFEAKPILDTDPDAFRTQLSGLIVQGYRPVSLSVARTSSNGLLTTASILHRPTRRISDRDRLAERQARAAVALLQLRKPDVLVRLLRHSDDPRVRSFIINLVKPLGTNGDVIASEFLKLNPSSRTTPDGRMQKIAAILYHPETSVRRALILALGTYGSGGLSAIEREKVVVNLLDLYSTDPDAGIHGASEWALRQFGRHKDIKNRDTELMRLKNFGERRWFINKSGQTFAIIYGSTDFQTGTQLSERPSTAADEIPHSRTFPVPFVYKRKK